MEKYFKEMLYATGKAEWPISGDACTVYWVFNKILQFQNDHDKFIFQKYWDNKRGYIELQWSYFAYISFAFLHFLRVIWFNSSTITHSKMKSGGFL